MDGIRVGDDRPISQNKHSNIRTPEKHKRKPAEDDDHRAERAARRSSFLARVMEQQKRQDAFKAARDRQRREQQQAAGAEEDSKHVKRKLSALFTTRSQPTGAVTAASRSKPAAAAAAAAAAADASFSVQSSRLKRAPDGLHYIEDSGCNLVGAKEASTEPLCVMLIHRRQRQAQGADATGAAAGEVDQGTEEEVVVRYLPMVDLLSAITRAQRGERGDGTTAGAAAASGLHQVHEGKEGLTTMHLEVDPDFSFLPDVFKADRGRSEDPHTARGASRPEPVAYDYFIPPAMRHVELLKEKHKGGVAYVKHKMKYDKKDLEDMGRKDRRSYLSCERRFLFMRQLQRDLEQRLENERRRQRQQERQRRMLGRVQIWQQRQLAGGNNSTGNTTMSRQDAATAAAAVSNALYTGDGNGNVGYHGNNLYITGREIPEDVVQTFFTLNDEYETFQRSMQRRQQRGRNGEGNRSTSLNRSSENVSGGEADVAMSAMRWGDMLLFPGQRPADGYVVVTAGPRDMRGWRRVLIGQDGGRQRRRKRAPAPRHIDLYAMSQRSAYQPSTSHNGNATAAASGQGTRGTAGSNGEGGGDADEDDEFSYMRHFRYQLFYADESDMDSDDDLLCGEADTLRQSKPATGSGPVDYGTGYYYTSLARQGTT